MVARHGWRARRKVEASDFNTMQDDYVVTPVYRGNYTETMTAAIAAFIGSPAMNPLPRAGLNGAIIAALPDTAYTVYVRAETVALSDAVELSDTVLASDHDAIRLPVTVTDIEPVGAETYVHVSGAGGESKPVSPVIREQGQASYGTRQSLTVHIPVAAMHHLYGQGTKRH